MFFSIGNPHAFTRSTCVAILFSDLKCCGRVHEEDNIIYMIRRISYRDVEKLACPIELSIRIRTTVKATFFFFEHTHATKS